MNRRKLILKRPTGWFAAGAEMAHALELLSDGSFKVFTYLCLNANRHTGKMTVRSACRAAQLRMDAATVQAHLGELSNRGVCTVGDGEIEITDAFWPYEKSTEPSLRDDQIEFLRKVRSAFLARACVDSVFTPADEKLATDLHQRGISFESINRAIWLGCARRYSVMLNGKSQTSVVSLAYFANLMDEVAQPNIPTSYWEHVRRRMEQLEKRWLTSGLGNRVEMRCE